LLDNSPETRIKEKAMSLSSQSLSKPKTLHRSQFKTNNKSKFSFGSKPGVPLFLQKSNDATGSKKPSHKNVISRAIQQTRHRGSSLSAHSKRGFESTLGHDLSQVRVHHGEQHNRLAHSLHAKAFTVGSDIFFGKGHYRPGTRDGDRLLAHELTHVVQQASGNLQAKQLEPGLQVGETNDRYEQEADRVADSFVNQGSVNSKQNSIYSRSVSSGEVIQLDEEDEQGFNYNVVPPALSYRRGGFGMSADTSAAQLSYFNDEGRANMGYQYGGDIFYGTNFNGFQNRFGLNPQTGVGSMSFGGSQEGFRFGLNANTAGSAGLSLGYGAPLLPMPMMLGEQVGAAWQGANTIGGAIPGFASDPIGAYGANSEHIGAMGAFGGSMGRLYDQQEQGGVQLGAGLIFAVKPGEYVFGAGLQGSF
jgi:hypothetical protein